jgi:hypothetical protein
MFYNIGPWSQYYKAFLLMTLRENKLECFPLAWQAVFTTLSITTFSVTELSIKCLICELS